MTIEQHHTENYSLYNADALEMLPSIPNESVDLVCYSPPFAKEGGGALYTYSSSPRDFSNATSYYDFFLAYEMLVKEIHRTTKPGCFSVVHCMAVPATCNLGNYITDFPAHIVQVHTCCRKRGCKASQWEKDRGICGHGWFDYIAEHVIWKEPLAVRNRTMAKGLAHQSIVENANLADYAGGDKVLMFRKKGERDRPVTHENGLLEYFGAATIPADLQHLRGMVGDQKQNRFSHWIWRRYASCIWDDIRGTLGEFDYGDYKPVLAYEEARDADDERHVHPLQLDVIARCIELRTNPGDVTLDMFGGVGSTAYQSVRMGRKSIYIDLKPAYFRQAVKNCAMAEAPASEQQELFPAS